ncbi:MAG: hypothetical protein ACJ8AT_05440, partial [Hyalangium sp.]|uniref:hypothetical protein n=1 Tax=Hyalangium sp. TaxID=2028555 RepID=UPI00389A4D70
AARKAAEAARKAAAEAAKKAAEQAKKAAAAKQAAEAAKAAAKKAAEEAKAKAQDKKDPAAAKKATEAAQAAAKEAVARQKAADAAQKAAEAAKAQAAKSIETAKKATIEANVAAKAEGKPEPFPLRNELEKTQYEDGHVDAAEKLGAAMAPTKAEMQGQLDVNREYDKLAQKPETRQALDKLGIKDGNGLKDYGQQLARAADGQAAGDAAAKKLESARKGTDAKALSEILQASANAAGDAGKLLADPKVADAIAGGKSPREAVVAKKADELPAEQKQNLEKIGVKPEEFVAATPKAQEHLTAAGEAAASGKADKALEELRGASAEGSRALAEKGVAELAKQQQGIGRDLLSDPKMAKAVLDDKATADSVGKILGGDADAKLQGVTELAKNDATRELALKTAGKDPQVQDALKKVGIEGKDLEKLGKGAAGVLEAAQAKEPGKALAALTEAFKANPDLIKGDLGKKLFDNVASKLTGMAKDFVSDPKVREAVLAGGSAALDALGKLGDPATALQGLTDLAKNDKLRDTVAKVAGAAKGVQEALAKVGLEPKDLLNVKDMLPSVLDAAQKAAGGNLGGAIDSLRDALKKGGPLSEKMLKGLAEQLPAGTAQNILKDPAVIKQIINNDAAFDSIKQLVDGKTLEGIGGLLNNAELRNSVLDAAGKDPKVQDLLKKADLTINDLKQAGDAAPHLFEAGKALFGGQSPDWQKALTELGAAAGAAPQLLEKLGAKIADKLPPEVTTKLTNLGITPEHLKEAGAALPHLINAAKAFPENPQEALKEIGQALKGSPTVVSDVVAKIGEKLQPGLLKDVLTDKDLVKQLVTDEKLHDSLGKLFSGTPEGIKEGLRGISADAPAMNAIASSLWKNDGLREKLQKVGFESAADLADAGSALDDVMNLKDALTANPPDIKAAIESGMGIINDLPEGLKNKIGDKLTKTLHLPEGLSDMVLQGAEAFKDPEVRQHFSEAVEAFGKHDVGGFIRAMGATGETLATKHPDLATGFLDMMGKMPGSVGRFFSDHSLNEGLVKSGAIGEVFQATQKLASGDITGALGDLMQGAGKVMGYGEHFKLEAPIFHHPSVTLPFGKEGLELMGKMAKQFVEALPEKVRTTIETKIAEAVAKAGGSAIPGGGIINAIGDGKDLIDELGKDNKDWVSIGLKGAEVALDVAGTFGIGGLTGPLRGVVGTIDVLHDASNMISDVKQFGNEFAFGTA